MPTEPQALIALRCKTCKTPVAHVIIGGGSKNYCFTCKRADPDIALTFHCSQCLTELTYDSTKERWQCGTCNALFPLLPPKPVYEDESFEWFKPPDNPRT